MKLLTFMLLLIPATLSAQTHPCDAAAPTTAIVVVGTSYKVQFCAKPAEAPEAFTVYLNGVASDLRPLTLVTAANAAGLAFYEGPREMSFPRGLHSLQVTIWNTQYVGGPSQESAKSNPLALSAVDSLPIPTAPKLIGVAR